MAVEATNWLEQAFWLDMIFVIMFAASAIALIIAAPLVLGTWLMPLRWAYAKWFAGPAARARFFARQNENPVTVFRYRLGMVFALIPLVLLAAMILVLILAMAAGNEHWADAIDTDLVLLGFFWVALTLIVIPFSYVYEFWVIHRTRHVRSWNFFLIFLFNLAIPVYFLARFRDAAGE